MKVEIEGFETPLTPFEIFTIYKENKNIAFLDSARDFATLGRYSFIGIKPYLILNGKDGKCCIRIISSNVCNDSNDSNDNECDNKCDNNGNKDNKDDRVDKNGNDNKDDKDTSEIYNCDVFQKLEQLINEYKVDQNFEIPFPAGFIGYFSYDLGLSLDKIKYNSKEGFDIPDIYFVLYDNIIIFDNLTEKKYISACGLLCQHEVSISKIREEIALAEVKHKSQGMQDILDKQDIKYMQSIQDNSIAKIFRENDNLDGFQSNFTREEYEKTVTKVKEYIKAGDIYIANLTQRFTKVTDKKAFDIYMELRKLNPAPFAAFLKIDDSNECCIISCSPERFMRIDNRIVETRPIKGTRPRGKTIEEDEMYRQELINSEKDKSELLMIVDLERNDMSKVCKPGSVKVTELFKLEEYSTVFHLVSTVIGELKENTSSLKCIKESFPGGSITGTPKIRAMEVIDELEGIKRSLYTGCIGYFSLNGNADFNIVIRTILKRGNLISFGVGGGITWDSVESEEYLETLDKARVFFKVLR